MQLLKEWLVYSLQTCRCAAPVKGCIMKPKGKPQRGVILIELMGSIEFGGAAYRNMKLDCWRLGCLNDHNCCRV